jgi:hypothetical protein
MPKPWYDEAFDNQFVELNHTVDFNLFQYLANCSKPGIRLTKFSIMLAQKGLAFDRLAAMSKEELGSLCGSVGMPPESAKLLLAKHPPASPDLPFEPPKVIPDYPYEDWSPTYAAFRKEVEEVFYLADKDGSGALDYDELQDVFQSPEFARYVLSNDTLDRDKSGSLDIFEWQDVLHPVWVQDPDAAKYIVGFLKKNAMSTRS